MNKVGLLICFLLLAGCVPPPFTPIIVIPEKSGGSCVLEPGKTVRVTFFADNIPANMQVDWKADGGGAITWDDPKLAAYTAPGLLTADQQVTITASFRYSGGSQVARKVCTVKALPTLTPTITPSSTVTPTVTPTLTLTPTPSVTFTSTPPSCLCTQFGNDLKSTFTCIIGEEAMMADNADPQHPDTTYRPKVLQIFDPAARVYRGDTKTWMGVMAYYDQEFAKVSHTNSQHFSPTLFAKTEVIDNTVEYYFTSGSSGDYTYRAEPTPAPTTTYNNKPGSDHWVFIKNERGCWVVKQFEINSSHLKFPPPQSTPTPTPKP
jgi:hypothetical protein